MDKFNNKDIKFIPPQLYEFRRLLKFQEIEKFSQYSMQRQQNGLEQWLPKYTKDLKLGVLPGKFKSLMIHEIQSAKRTYFQYLSNIILINV